VPRFYQDYEVVGGDGWATERGKKIRTRTRKDDEKREGHITRARTQKVPEVLPSPSPSATAATTKRTLRLGSGEEKDHVHNVT